MTKTCKICETVLTPANKVHWRRLCKICKKKDNHERHLSRRKTNSEWWEKRKAKCRAEYYQNKPRVKNANLLRLYGISLSDYLKLAETQNHKCAICGQPERALHNGKPKALAVDHSHKTGKVRALLCHACNTGIGAFEENSQLLNRAANYIESCRFN